MPLPSPKSRAASPKPLKPILGYCTNVHAGPTLEEIKRNLEEHTLEVKRQVSPNRPMGVGLWLPAHAVLAFLPPELDGEIATDRVIELREWLESRGLYAYTLNGFPVTNFHDPVVKHQVYLPDWSTPERLNYTMALTMILHELLPPGAEGSISTLPIGWADSVAPSWTDRFCDMIEFLDAFHQQTGRVIHLDIEPEPGCEIGDTMDLIMHLTAIEAQSGIDLDVLHRHLRICLDVCHSAVMFEEPTCLLEAAREAGWSIGKVQISSALRVPFEGKSAAQKDEMRTYLQRFAEDRYLHQTIIAAGEDDSTGEFYDDLPEALADHETNELEWRIHYHVPVHLDHVGPLETTQSHIIELLAAINPEDNIRHFEVETYAWSVLPDELQEDRLADGIAREMRWASALLEDHA